MVQNAPSEDDRPDLDGGDESARPGTEKTSAIAAVRYGLMRYVGEFTHPPDMKLDPQAKVVVQTKRGIEIGEQVSLTCQGCSQLVSRQQILDFTADSGSVYYELGSGKVLREATQDDLAEYDRINSSAKARRDLCQAMARQHELDMKVVACEPLFGGERIVFYFVADGRVDFRALVKDLAREFQTRIEMRQVGTRDEARLVADYETCGRECCCRTFLKSLKPVSMKMAKLQKATLDPSKVSGRCGRLKCCLRYEHTGYEELDDRLPKVGARVTTRYGSGTVLDRQILTQLLQINTEGGGRLAIGIEDVLPPGQTAETIEPAGSWAPPGQKGESAEPAAEPAPDTREIARAGRGRRKGRGPVTAGSRAAEPTGEAPAAAPSPSADAGPTPPDETADPEGPKSEPADGRTAGADDRSPPLEAASQEPPAGTDPPRKEGGSKRRRRRRRPRGRRTSESGGADRAGGPSGNDKADPRQQTRKENGSSSGGQDQGS